jgi:GNAT superfamily N-acetyltransferase
MKLEVKKVNSKLKDKGAVKRLMKTAFPENEQIPMYLLKMLALRKNVNFLAFYDEDKFVGTMYTVESNKCFFILYLAVCSDVRSKGYGGKILDYAYEMADGRNIVLNVESPTEIAPNLEQRLKRIEFYKKHDILETGFSFMDDGVLYSVLASNVKNFDYSDYENLLSSLSFGKRKFGRK